MSSDWSPIAKQYDPLKAGSIDGTDTKPHDHGIVRAMQATFTPNDKVIGNPKLTIFVSQLNPQTSEETLKQVFSQFGDIERCRIVRDIVTGFSKCYGFVEYKNEDSALRTYRDAFKMLIEGQEIFVDFECERTLKGWIPRRLGGGFGGKKESGQLRFGGRDRPFRKPILPNTYRGRGHGYFPRFRGRGRGGYRETDRFQDDRRPNRDYHGNMGRDRDRHHDRSKDRERSRDRERNYHKQRERPISDDETSGHYG